MSRGSITYEKSRGFASRIVKLYLFLCGKGEYVMSKQLLRSGTSIGANLAESIYAVSSDDFSNKISIALKECSETRYWLDLLYDNDFLTSKMFKSISKDCDDILHMLIATVKTMRAKADKEAK